MLIAKFVADIAAHHSRKHDAKVHNATGKGIMCHLMFARCHLLHHEKRQSYKAKAITEVFHNDAAAYQPKAFRLIKCQERVGHERDIESPAPSEGGGDQACEELGCTLFVLPSFGGVGGGSRVPSGEPLWGGCTTYLYLVKIKIHLMINSLVCVPSPFITVKNRPCGLMYLQGLFNL